MSPKRLFESIILEQDDWENKELIPVYTRRLVVKQSLTYLPTLLPDGGGVWSLLASSEQVLVWLRLMRELRCETNTMRTGQIERRDS